MDDGLEPLAGDAPLWTQIADRIRRRIIDGTFPAGVRVPGEAELNRRFGVSRTTSRAALDCLETEGLIVRQAGRGSTVVEPRIERPLNRLSSFSEDLTARGLKASYETLILRVNQAPVAVAVELGLKVGAPTLAIKRMMSADGVPIAMSKTHITLSILKHCALPTARELDQTSLYRWLIEKAGIRLRSGRERIEAAIADAATARALRLVQPSAILISRRTSWAEPKRPVEYVVTKYRADCYSLHVDLSR